MSEKQETEEESSMAEPESIEVIEISYHRNGVAGEPFYAVTFKFPFVEGLDRKSVV